MTRAIQVFLMAFALVAVPLCAHALDPTLGASKAGMNGALAGAKAAPPSASAQPIGTATSPAPPASPHTGGLLGLRCVSLQFKSKAAQRKADTLRNLIADRKYQGASEQDLKGLAADENVAREIHKQLYQECSKECGKATYCSSS